MQIKVPRTMTALVTAGCLLAALPLLAALLFAELALERLTKQTQMLLDEGLSVVQLGMQLRDEVGDLERSYRQYLVLEEPGLLAIGERRWNDTRQTLTLLQRHSFDPAVIAIAGRVGAAVDHAREVSRHHPEDNTAMFNAAQEIHALLPDTDAIIGSSRQQVETQMRRLRSDTQRARREMIISALTLIPLGGLLAYGFSMAITRPIKHMIRAIAALGHGHFEPALVVEFPREMRRLGQQIDWLRRRLAELEEGKDRFLRQVSHELKTPLSSLREGTELLREGALGALTRRQKEVAEILSESTEELEELIENLLAYAEWRAERQQAQKTWFDARGLVEEVLAVHKLPLAKRELRVELDIREERLFALRSQMRVALDNLITNAIKHSPPRSTIEVGVAVVDDAFELAVRDHGRGVAEAERGKIFEPFVRGTEVEEEGIRGTGIGLSIVKETVLAHGGSVTVADAAPGASFRLVWPCPIT